MTVPPAATDDVLFEAITDKTGLSLTFRTVEDVPDAVFPPSSPLARIVKGAELVPVDAAVIVHVTDCVPSVVNCTCCVAVGIVNNPELSVSVAATFNVPETDDAVMDDVTVILSSFTIVVS
ncbi:Uncharacterised protein [uncultured archaeon]|nr:Uncharacterised protein [uncultured archaeon]